jgi:hypothetical protein
MKVGLPIAVDLSLPEIPKDADLPKLEWDNCNPSYEDK